MAGGAVRGHLCEKWQRGLDCEFNEWWYWLVLTVLWLLTAMPFLKKVLCRSANAPTGMSRCCLLLTAISALLNAVDACVFLLFGTREKKSEEYGSATFSSLASIPMIFALRLFGNLWCDVSKALSKLQQAPDDAKAWRWTLIRRGYDVAAFGHVPFACMLAIADYDWGPDFDQAITIYSVWCGVSLFFLFSALALAMWCIAKGIKNDTRACKLVKVTGINLAEQALYNVFLMAELALFFSESYNKFGLVQLVVYILMFLLPWLLHVQVFIFFYVCDPKDPFYSQDELDALLRESSTSVPEVAVELGETIGSSSAEVTQC